LYVQTVVSLRVLTSDQRQPFNAVEISVLDGHNSLVSKELLGVVVDELSVDEDVDVVLADQLHLVLHLLLLGQLDFGHL
jgi:hypothetical protein